MCDQLCISQFPDIIECLLEEDKARYFVAEIVLSYAQLTVSLERAVYSSINSMYDCEK